MSGLGLLLDGGPAARDLFGGVVPVGVAGQAVRLLAEQWSSHPKQPVLVSVGPDKVGGAGDVCEGVPLAGRDEIGELALVVDHRLISLAQLRGTSCVMDVL